MLCSGTLKFGEQLPDTTPPPQPYGQISFTGEEIVGRCEAGAFIQVTDPLGRIVASGYCDSNGDFRLPVNPPLTNGEAVQIVARDDAGNLSTPGQTTAHDTTPPDAPWGPSVNNDGDQLTGRTEPGATVEVQDPQGNTIGRGTAGSDGYFTVTLDPPMKNGETVSVTAMDASGNTSAPSAAAAPDITEPAAPSSLSISPDGDVITGNAEPNSKIEVFDPDGNYIGIATTDPSGQFSVTLSPPQTAGQTLSVMSTDPAGNPSAPTDIIAPVIPFPCFTRGTMIATQNGPIAVENLKVGDLLFTSDNGLQPIRWIGSRTLGPALLGKNEKLRPIRIRAGALGANTPSEDLLVSPQHRILVRSKIAQKMFGAAEVLVAAKQLLHLDGVDIATEFLEVEYFHILFERHEIVLSNGAETESLYIGPEALKAVGPAAREEIFQIFPELLELAQSMRGAREMASGRQARKLAVRHQQNKQALVSVSRSSIGVD